LLPLVIYLRNLHFIYGSKKPEVLPEPRTPA
jgi:hypothetical protein